MENLKLFRRTDYPPPEVLQKIPDAEILIAGSSGIEKISKELIDGLKNLKFVSLFTIVTDWVDLKAAREKNIPVSNIKGANSESVAEHTWGMILNLSKRISEFERDCREKGAYKFGPYQGKEVEGKTIGIIGLGDIGQKVARISKAFDMKILGLNKSKKNVNGVELTDMKTLLTQSDIIAVCVPLNEETRNLIGENEISLMKNDAILINSAREQIVDKKAVINAIKNKKLFGYGIETEIMIPVPKDDEYFKYPNILLTPHNAFNTEDAERKSFDLVIKNIEAFINGKPQNVVN